MNVGKVRLFFSSSQLNFVTMLTLVLFCETFIQSGSLKLCERDLSLAISLTSKPPWCVSRSLLFFSK